MAINYLSLRNIYPTAPGDTLGNYVTVADPDDTAESVTTRSNEEVEQALTIGGQANPLTGMLVFGALVVVLMLIAQRMGDADEFRNLRLSAYNVLITSLIAVAGIPVWKTVFTKVKVPGVSTWVLSV